MQLEKSDSEWVAPSEELIERWDAACIYPQDIYGKKTIVGKYNRETGYFNLNGLDDITTAEAMEIMEYMPLCKKANWFADGQFYLFMGRTLFPINVAGDLAGEYMALQNTFADCPNLEKVVFYAGVNGYRGKQIMVAKGRRMFVRCPKLKVVVGELNVSSISIAEQLPWFVACQSLEDVRLAGLKLNYSYLKDCLKINIESVSFLVANAVNTAPITVTVHPNVYAKLTDEGNEEWHRVLTDAIEKQITFASA